ncbi:isoprenoid synthase domain-containing protein [Collybia nuda]|uniref:Terpene synthase n=1 Tax=Collybia nuda TaxID=64659 RepID=A0A9P5XW28_9AGAR|nr:isoprenoid synthase domain-containing protein [Collybia nuda]
MEDHLTSSSAQTQLYCIPDTLIRWPWPARTSLHVDKIKAILNTSFKKYPQIERKALKMLEQCEIAFFVCCVYPGLDEAQLDVTAIFCIIGWLVDEIITESIDHVQTTSDIIMDALRDPSKSRPLEEHIIGEITRQWWLQAIREMTPVSLQRLFHAVEDWLLACVQQSSVVFSSEKETIEKFLERRSSDVAMSICMVLLEMNVDIPQRVWEHPILETVRSLMCHIVSLDNVRMLCSTTLFQNGSNRQNVQDMFSYNREQANGDYHNFIHVVMSNQQLNLEEAYKWANQRHQDLQKKYMETLARMPSWGAEIDAQVEKYIGGLGRMISGNVKYSISCLRYADGRKEVGDRDNRVFELLPSSKPTRV